MDTWELRIENIGGIRSGRAELAPGTNVVQASNWQGKSSLLKAIQTVMGTTGLDGERHPLTQHADSGSVTLDTGDRTCTTRLERSNGTIHRIGETYLTDEVDVTCARLFAFLGEENPVRRAVRTDGDLLEVLTRPLDIEDIDEQIAELERERDSVEEQLAEAREAANELIDAEESVQQLEQKLASLREEYADFEDDESQDDPDRETLSDKRATRSRLEGQIERLEGQLERHATRLEQKREQLAELDVPDAPEREVDVETKRQRIEDLDAKIDLLETVWQTNQRVIDEDEIELLADVEHGLVSDEVDCWVCGEQVTREQMETRLEAIRDRIDDLRTERTDLEATLEDVERRRQEIQSKRREKTELERSISELEARREDARADLADARDELEQVDADIEQLEREIEAEDDRRAELHSEITVTESELEEERKRLEALESKAERRDDYERRHETVREEIESLRTQRYRKKRELAEEFAVAMDEVVETFAPGFEAARLDVKTEDDEIVAYELVVAREGVEARLDALSKGELELLGIVAALAGYETFDVSERVPLILLDGIGPLASDHVHTLVEYLSQKSDYLVTTAYPEAGTFQGHTVTPEEWQVVSNDRGATP